MREDWGISECGAKIWLFAPNKILIPIISGQPYLLRKSSSYIPILPPIEIFLPMYLLLLPRGSIYHFVIRAERLIPLHMDNKYS